MRTRITGAAIAVAMALTVASCGGGADVEATDTDANDPTLPADESPTPTVDTTSTPAPTAAPTPTPGATPTPLPTPTPAATATPLPGCNAPFAGTAVRATVRFVDLDGDGDTDVMTVYGLGPESSPTAWRIRVETAAGEAFDSPLDADVSGLAPITAVGGGDIDGDGTDELFSVVGAGASATIVAIHTRDGCDLVPLTVGAAPAQFPVGGSVGSMGGLTCTEERTLIEWSGSADFDAGDGTYDITGRQYRLADGALIKLGDLAFTAKLTDPDFVYGELTCHGLTL